MDYGVKLPRLEELSLTTPDFIVVFAGKPLDGFDAMAVQIAIEGALKLTEAQSEKFFSGKPVVIKRSQDKAAALKLAQQLKSLGAEVSVRVDNKEKAAEHAQQPAGSGAKQSHDSTTTVSSTEEKLSLAENTGFLVEPTADPIPPSVDLSSFSVTNEDYLLSEDEHDHVAPIELDLSSISVKENDGSPLVEPSPDVPATVIAPELELDEAGAILETVGGPEPVAEPDLSALSLKATEGDLLEAHERAPNTKIEVDTSRLGLTPE